MYIFYVHWHMIARELFQLVRHVGHTEKQAEEESRRLLHLLTVSLWNLQKSFIFCQYAMHTIHNCTHIPIPSIATQIHIFLPLFLYLSTSLSFSFYNHIYDIFALALLALCSYGCMCFCTCTMHVIKTHWHECFFMFSYIAHKCLTCAKQT